jgi:hypothetical protein
MFWLAVLAQASPLFPTIDPPLGVPVPIDLLVPPDCTSDDGDVVVCARAEDRRVRPLVEPPRPIGPPDGPLSFRLPGGGSGKLRAIQTELPGGKGSGAAVTLTVPF